MSFLIDTDVCSAYLKGNRDVWPRFIQYGGRLHVSSITVGELFTWALRANASPKRLPSLTEFLRDVTVLDVTAEVARQFGELRASLLDKGQGTPDLDLLVAATAVLHNFTLVTHNVQDYAQVPGLRIDDWIAT